MNLEKLVVIVAALGVTYPYPMENSKAIKSIDCKKRKPEPCKTDAAYIAAEAKRQKRIQRNIGVSRP